LDLHLSACRTYQELADSDEKAMEFLSKIEGKLLKLSNPIIPKKKKKKKKMKNVIALDKFDDLESLPRDTIVAATNLSLVIMKKFFREKIQPLVRQMVE